MITGATFAVSANLLLLSTMRLLRVPPDRISDNMCIAMIAQSIVIIAWRLS